MDVHYRTYGAGPPLIILHGLFGSLDNWATLARFWGRSFRVWTYDARNHGRSFHDPRIDYRIMAADLLAFMDEHGIGTAHLLGHSMGGKTAMQCALEHPARVDRLVVVDIAPREYDRRHDPILRILLAADPSAWHTRAEADAEVSGSIPEAATRQFLLKNLARNERGTFRWKMNLPAIDAAYDTLRGAIPGGGRFDGPVLVVRGERSSYVSDADMPRILELFPRASMATVRNAGHWVHADAPADLSQIVLQFLLEQ